MQFVYYLVVINKLFVGSPGESFTKNIFPIMAWDNLVYRAYIFLNMRIDRQHKPNEATIRSVYTRPIYTVYYIGALALSLVSLLNRQLPTVSGFCLFLCNYGVDLRSIRGLRLTQLLRRESLIPASIHQHRNGEHAAEPEAETGRVGAKEGGREGDARHVRYAMHMPSARYLYVG